MGNKSSTITQQVALKSFLLPIFIRLMTLNHSQPVITCPINPGEWHVAYLIKHCSLLSTPRRRWYISRLLEQKIIGGQYPEIRKMCFHRPFCAKLINIFVRALSQLSNALVHTVKDESSPDVSQKGKFTRSPTKSTQILVTTVFMATLLRLLFVKCCF